MSDNKKPDNQKPNNPSGISKSGYLRCHSMPDDHDPALSQTLDLGLREGPHTVVFDGHEDYLNDLVQHLCYGYSAKRQAANDEINEMFAPFFEDLR